MSQSVDPELIAAATIPHFLRSLMKIERERQGISRQAASASAQWSSSTWGNLERNSRSLQPHHWLNIAAVLGLSQEDEVRRLNAFIGKHPTIWLERMPTGVVEVCERALTSPHRIRSAHVFSVQLDPARPALYYRLSAYTSEPEELINLAAHHGFLKARETPNLDQGRRSTRPSAIPANLRDSICQTITHSVAEDKLKLLERMVDKFERFPASDLARAYQHFSLSLTSK